MTDNNLLVLIDINTILKEKIIPYHYQAVQRYFRDNILFTHALKKGVGRLSYRGSVIVRYNTKNVLVLKAKQTGGSIKINEIGRLFKEMNGETDDFILSRLKENMPTGEIEKQFTEKAKSLMASSTRSQKASLSLTAH